jgi:quinol monooxygenase YgiN
MVVLKEIRPEKPLQLPYTHPHFPNSFTMIEHFDDKVVQQDSERRPGRKTWVIELGQDL